MAAADKSDVKLALVHTAANEHERSDPRLKREGSMDALFLCPHNNNGVGKGALLRLP